MTGLRLFATGLWLLAKVSIFLILFICVRLRASAANYNKNQAKYPTAFSKIRMPVIGKDASIQLKIELRVFMRTPGRETPVLLPPRQLPR